MANGLASPTKSWEGNAERVIYDEIHRAIAERRLVPGEKLTEEVLVDVFGVSRARIRKVLLLLAKENVVQLEPNRGAFVWHPTVADAKNILEARKIVELELVRKAAVSRTATQVAKLRKLVAKEQKALKKGGREEIMRLSGDFHIAIAEVANNPILADFLKALVSRCYLILATYQNQDQRNCPQDDHEAIVEAIAAKDAERSIELMTDHFTHIEQELELHDRPKVKQDLHKIFRTRT